MNCPVCNVRHRKFPRQCYYQAHGEYAHVVIARVASHGTSDQKAWAQEATERWAAMQDYIKAQGWDEFDQVNVKSQ